MFTLKLSNINLLNSVNILYRVWQSISQYFIVSFFNDHSLFINCSQYLLYSSIVISLKFSKGGITPINLNLYRYC